MPKVEFEYIRTRTVTIEESGTLDADVPQAVLDGGHLETWLTKKYEEDREFAKRVDAAAEASEERETISWESAEVVS